MVSLTQEEKVGDTLQLCIYRIPPRPHSTKQTFSKVLAFCPQIRLFSWQKSTRPVTTTGVCTEPVRSQHTLRTNADARKAGLVPFATVLTFSFLMLNHNRSHLADTPKELYCPPTRRKKSKRSSQSDWRLCGCLSGMSWLFVQGMLLFVFRNNLKIVLDALRQEMSQNCVINSGKPWLIHAPVLRACSRCRWVKKLLFPAGPPCDFVSDSPRMVWQVTTFGKGALKIYPTKPDTGWGKERQDFWSWQRMSFWSDNDTCRGAMGRGVCGKHRTGNTQRWVKSKRWLSRSLHDRNWSWNCRKCLYPSLSFCSLRVCWETPILMEKVRAKNPQSNFAQTKSVGQKSRI